MINSDILFQHSSIGIIATNKDGEILLVNPYAAKMFGYEENELLSQKIELLLPESIKSKHIKLREDYAAEPTVRPMGAGRDLIAVKKDGEEFYVEISLSFYKSDGDLTIVSFINDITESKKFRDELKAANFKLEQKVEERTKELSDALHELNDLNIDLKTEVSQRKLAEEKAVASFEKEKELNELKSRFVSMASHEFRTPLAGVLSSVTLIDKYLEMGNLERCNKHIKSIKNSVHNLTSILNDFLSLDKLEEGHIQANPSQFFLQDELKNIIDEAKGSISEEFLVKYEHHGGNPKLNQDKQILKNIMINLISNAAKYSGDSRDIQIISKTDEVSFLIKIQDFGIGIPDKDQEKLFSRFHRAENVTNIQGTGLGLSIVKKYLEFIGGEITFESKLGFGTSFMLKIPMELQL